MHHTDVVNTIWFLMLTTACGLWRLQPTTANRLIQQNTNPSVTEFGTNEAILQQCFEKTIFARSRSPAAVSHLALTSSTYNGIWTTIFPRPIRYVKVETLDDTYGGANVEMIGRGINMNNIVLSITDGNRRPYFRSNIKVVMLCYP